MADGENPREEIIQRLEIYIEALQTHMQALTRMHDEGVIPDSVYEQEMAMFAGEIDQCNETLSALKRRQAGSLYGHVYHPPTNVTRVLTDMGFHPTASGIWIKREGGQSEEVDRGKLERMYRRIQGRRKT